MIIDGSSSVPFYTYILGVPIARFFGPFEPTIYHTFLSEQTSPTALVKYYTELQNVTLFPHFFLDDKYSADKNKTQTLNLRVKIEDYICNDYIARLYHILIIKHVFSKANFLAKVVK